MVNISSKWTETEAQGIMKPAGEIRALYLGPRCLTLSLLGLGLMKNMQIYGDAKLAVIPHPPYPNRQEADSE